MATSIPLNPETERRLDFPATQTGRAKAFYLPEIAAAGACARARTQAATDPPTSASATTS